MGFIAQADLNQREPLPGLRLHMDQASSKWTKFPPLSHSRFICLGQCQSRISKLGPSLGFAHNHPALPHSAQTHSPKLRAAHKILIQPRAYEMKTPLLSNKFISRIIFRNSYDFQTKPNRLVVQTKDWGSI